MEERQRFGLFRLAMLVSIVLTVLPLAAQDVTYNLMPGTDFSKFHTYKWVSNEGSANRNQIVDAQTK
jgi:hypothetical protein